MQPSECFRDETSRHWDHSSTVDNRRWVSQHLFKNLLSVARIFRALEWEKVKGKTVRPCIWELRVPFLLPHKPQRWATAGSESLKKNEAGEGNLLMCFPDLIFNQFTRQQAIISKPLNLHEQVTRKGGTLTLELVDFLALQESCMRHCICHWLGWLKNYLRASNIKRNHPNFKMHIVIHLAKNCGSRKDKWPSPMCLYTRHTCHGTARRDIRIRNYVYMHGIPTIYPQKYCGPMAKDYGDFNPFAFTAEAP